MNACEHAIGAVRHRDYSCFNLSDQETYDSSLDTFGIPILLSIASVCWQCAGG